MKPRNRFAEPCGCRWEIEPNGSEHWVELCAAHDAEHRALHAAAQQQHREELRLRALAEEFT